MLRQDPRKGFPQDFSVQRIRSAEVRDVADLPGAQIAAYFKRQPQVAKDILLEVGWYSSGYHCVQSFPVLEDAAADYLLFSLGKGRWNPLDHSENSV